MVAQRGKAYPVQPDQGSRHPFQARDLGRYPRAGAQSRLGFRAGRMPSRSKGRKTRALSLSGPVTATQPRLSASLNRAWRSTPARATSSAIGA